ncbi:hypothetical protein RD1_3926 [Roseobacter denitrificans OCh 114]|uniref:Uncharacterized protein n=1 Tax=Roseobacter denitrificans (strain ATCC 33942 / OCh 114) TaxID=375451 RepID=Q161G0_ROSDO|nr:hypothetical protein RD1_3926 [Roseobacter denitrificans OCh 114]
MVQDFDMTLQGPFAHFLSVTGGDADGCAADAGASLIG